LRLAWAIRRISRGGIGSELDADCKEVEIGRRASGRATIEDLSEARFGLVGPLDEDANRDGLGGFKHDDPAIELAQRDGDGSSAIAENV
jgi:hypothetical protein